MKRPECMEKPLDWSGVPVTTLCPKCGSEMKKRSKYRTRLRDGVERVTEISYWSCKCGYSEKVKT